MVRVIMKSPFVVCVLAVLSCGVEGQADPFGVGLGGKGEEGNLPALRDGDIVFHESQTAQAPAVSLVTNSRYSHVGVILMQAGKPMVLETGSTVRILPLDRWIASGRRGHVVIKRRTDAAALLTPAAINRLHAVGESYLGRGYDIWFLWDDERLYCSELVFKLYQAALGVEVGTVERFGDFNLDEKAKQHPVVQSLIQTRYGGVSSLPLDELVVTPESIFVHPSLSLIYSN